MYPTLKPSIEPSLGEEALLVTSDAMPQLANHKAGYPEFVLSQALPELSKHHHRRAFLSAQF
jgi:hypothetical protein